MRKNLEIELTYGENMTKIDIETMVRDFRKKPWVGQNYKTNTDMAEWCKSAGWEVEEFITTMGKTIVDEMLITIDESGLTLKKVPSQAEHSL